MCSMHQIYYEILLQTPKPSKMMQLFEIPDYAEMFKLAKFADIIMRQFRTR